MPAENLIELILYLTPGFIAISVYHAVHPARRKSQFEEIAWSLVCSIPIVAIVRWVDKSLLGQHLGSGGGDFPEFPFVAAIWCGGLVVGGFLVLVHFIRFKVSRWFPGLNAVAPDPQSIWARINQPANRDWAVVFMKDGSIYLGGISEYTFDPNQENQDFLLIKAKRVKDDLSVLYKVDGIGVYLNTRDVQRIEFVKGE